MLDEKLNKTYEDILINELIVARGCTEPISLALSSAKLIEIKKEIPLHIEAYISGNIIKNVQGVIIPRTNNHKGVIPSLLVGLLIGDTSYNLDILSKFNEDKISKLDELVSKNIINVNLAKSCKNLYIKLEATYLDNDKVTIIIEDFHNNFTLIKYNEDIIYSKHDLIKKKKEEYNLLNVNDIFEFANSNDLTRIKPYLERQIEYNFEIAKEGIKNKYGSMIGKIILDHSNENVKEIAKAYTSAASDARMAGCNLPVVIISGSGNQGLTTSVPLIVYAKHFNISHEKLLRSLVLSDLIALEEKKDIGRLSAFCGAISAGIASSSAIAYMLENNLEAIKHTIINGLALASGIICDGAKASCAGKIALALESGLLGYYMYKNNSNIHAGDGIIKETCDETIKSVGRLAKKGMKQTDKEILNIMIDK